MATMLLSNCSQNQKELESIPVTSSVTPSPQPTVTQQPESPLTTNVPSPVPPPTLQEENGQKLEAEEMENPDSQPLPYPYNFVDTTFSISENQYGPSPIDIKQQLGYYSGGGAARGDLPNNCLRKHFGITNYDKPTMVEGLMSQWYQVRTLQPSQKESIWQEELPDICACGFKADETVTLTIENPLQESVFENQLIAQPVRGTNEEIIEGVYCIESDVISEFDFLPGEPLGTYKVTVEAESGVADYEFQLEEGSTPYFFYSNRLGGYVLGGLEPHEIVVTAIYETSSSSSAEFVLAHAITVETDDYGIAFIKGENTLVGEAYKEDAELQAPIAIFRGDPTTEYFETLTYYGSFWGNVGFVTFNAEADFNSLIEQHPDNPYIYYHQGDIEKFLELAPDSDLAIEVKSNELYSQAIEEMKNYLFASNPVMTHLEPSEEERQLAIAQLSEIIDILTDPTTALAARADAYAMGGEYELALADILTAANLNPKNTYFPLMEANVHLLSGDYELALDSFEKTISINPNSLQGYYKMGCVYDQLGNTDQASDNFLKNIKVWLDSNNFNNASISMRVDPDENYYGYLEGKDSEFDKGSCLETYDTFRINYLQQNPISFEPERSIVIHPADNMQILYVPAGEFFMGSLPEDVGAESIEFPQHSVNLDAYWIDYQEVTLNQYALCVKAGACDPPAQGISENILFDGENPVTGITWTNAMNYCTWVGRRLPTEAEWEKAARGIDARVYPWGNSPPNVCETNWNVNYDSGGVRALYPESVEYSCVAPSGTIDMAGNAWEWVADYFSEDYYIESPSENPLGPTTGEERVVRGGSWTTSNVNFLRTANRWHRPEAFSSESIGFRCALSDIP